MNYTHSYLTDLVKIQAAVPNIENLKGKKILITGAGGLICSALVDFLMQLNDSRGYKINIYVAARNLERLKYRFGNRLDRNDIHYVYYDATQPIEFKDNIDYLIHGASNANPATYIKQPVETMIANFVGLKNILEYLRTNSAERVVYISSSEVYGKKDDNLAYKEDDYNYLDILNPRACYPSSKRAAETLCVAYQHEYNVDSVIVRPGHIYGPTMTETDNRAASEFARDVIKGKDIVMKSAGQQLRSYCYVLDCVSAIFAVMLNGHGGEAYNVSNKNSVVTIRELAECFAKLGGKNLKFEIPTELEKASYNLMDNSSLDAKKLEDLGWFGQFSLDEGVKATLLELQG